MRNASRQRIARPKLLIATTQSQFKNLKLYRFVLETPDFPARDVAQEYGRKQYDADMKAGLGIIAKNTEGSTPKAQCSNKLLETGTNNKLDFLVKVH